MSEPIGPGDLVECIESHDPALLTVGSVYCVSFVGPEARCACMRAHRPWAFNHVGLLLSDAPPPVPYVAWCSYMFRPVSRRSDFEAILEQLKTPAPEDAPTRVPETV